MEARTFRKNLVVAVLVSLLVLSSSVTAASTKLVEAIGGASSDKIYCATRTSDGGVVMTGYTSSYGANGEDVLLIKVDSCGNTVWTKTLGGDDDEEGRCVIETSDGGLVVTGYTNSFGGGQDNLLIVKFNSGGIKQWTRIHKRDALPSGAPPLDFYGYSVIQDSDGNLVVSGYMYRSDTPRKSLLLAKFSSGGGHIKTRTVYNSAHPLRNHYGYSVVQTSGDGYLVAGRAAGGGIVEDILLVAFHADGDLDSGLWIADQGNGNPERAYSLIRNSDNGYALTGVTGDDLFVLRRDQNLNPVWGKKFSNGSTLGRSIIQTYDGSFVVTGEYSNRSGDMLLAKCDFTGNHVWTKSIGGANGHDIGRTVTEDPAHNLSVLGYTDSWGAGSYDVLLALFDPNGVTCLDNYGGPSSDDWDPTDGDYPGLKQWEPLQIEVIDWLYPDTTDITPAETTVCTSAEVVIIYPTEIDTLCAGTRDSIVWDTTHACLAPYLRMRYSLDGGSTWSGWYVNIQNDGRCNWDVPCTTSSDSCLIVLADVDGYVFDTSDQFSIIKPSIEITSPSQGEIITQLYYDIEWENGCPEHCPSVKLQYSSDGGGYWGTISSSATNDGSYTWRVPTIWSDECLIRIGVGDNCWCGTSDMFSIHRRSCPYVSAWHGEEFIRDNNILPQSEELGTGEDVTDHYLLRVSPQIDGWQYRFRIEEFENEHTYADQLELAIIDHSPDLDVAVSDEGEVFTYVNLVAPKQVQSSLNTEHYDLLTHADGRSTMVQTEEEVTMNFGPVSNSYGGRLVAVMGGDFVHQLPWPFPPPDTGLPKYPIHAKIVTSDSYVSHSTVTLRPRENGTIAIADVSDLLPRDGRDFIIKISFPANHAVDFIGLDLSEQVPLEMKRVPLAWATHSKRGDVTQELSSSDGIYAELLPGEHIDLAFDFFEPQAGLQRDFVLISTGHYHTIGKAPDEQQDSPQTLTVANYPNPFNPVTNIELYLPIASEWKVTIYNIVGQEVAEFDGQSGAGKVTVTWDASGEASGVYLYRVQAGALTASRKMLLLK